MIENHTFESDGHQLAYSAAGPKGGKPALLVHGFTGSALKDFIRPGWLELLAAEGYRVVAIDHLGHGQSEKPEGDPSLYTPSNHATRLKALADHLDWQAFDLIGYSMGGRISIEYALSHPKSVNHFTLVGVGLNVLSANFLPPFILNLFEKMVNDADALPDDLKKMRDGLVAEGQLLAALLDCAKGIAMEAVDLNKLIAFDKPTQIVQALNDPIGAGADRLAGAFKAAHVEVPDADHVSVMADKRFHKAVLDFWQA